MTTLRHRNQCAPLAALLALVIPAAAPAAVLPVTTLEDADAAEGECSLREAIIAANTDAAYQECPAGTGADEIEIGVPGTIALLADLPQVQAALTVRGLGASASVIDGGGAFEIFHITNAAAGNGELLRIEGLQLTGGSAGDGGAIYAGRNRALEVVDCVLTGNQSTLDGGAIYGDRPVSIEILRSSLAANTAGAGGGGLAIQFGGVATVVDSTFAGNAAASGPGGAIYALVAGNLVIRQSTFSGNSATADGGGLAAVATPLRVESSTLAGNQADSDGNDNGDAGGLSLSGAVTGTLVGTLLATNQDLSPAGGTICPDGQRKLGGTLATEGFNLIGANDCSGPNFPPGLPNVNGDLVGTAAAPIDPLLNPLEDNGGPTLTHLPMSASPVVDQGSCPGYAGDQRGYGSGATLLRIVDDPAIPDFGDGCDVGSVEVGAVSLDGLIFVGDFESGDTSHWSLVVP